MNSSLHIAPAALHLNNVFSRRPSFSDVLVDFARRCALATPNQRVHSGHVNGNYNLTSANTTCICHQADFNGTTNPNHVQSNFPTTCQQCHTTTTWGNATFDHSTTGFPLTGAHTALQCTQCHERVSARYC